MRKSPPINDRYIYIVCLIEKTSDSKNFIINNPSYNFF
ncbi:hypothetical protein [Dysgonomonas sp. Marseille-P4677]